MFLEYFGCLLAAFLACGGLPKHRQPPGSHDCLAQLMDSHSGGVHELRGAQGHVTCSGVSYLASLASPVGPVARSLWLGSVDPVSYLLAHLDVLDLLRHVK